MKEIEEQEDKVVIDDENNNDASQIMMPQRQGVRQLEYAEIENLKKQGFFKEYLAEKGLDNSLLKPDVNNLSGYVVLTTGKMGESDSRILKVEEITDGKGAKEYKIVDDTPGGYVSYNISRQMGDILSGWARFQDVASNTKEYKAIQSYIETYGEDLFELGDKPTLEQAQKYYGYFDHLSDLVDNYNDMLKRKGIYIPNGQSDIEKNILNLLGNIYVKADEFKHLVNHLTLDNPDVVNKNKSINKYLESRGLNINNRLPEFYDYNKSGYTVFQNEQATCIIKIDTIKNKKGNQYKIDDASSKNYAYYNLKETIKDILKQTRQLKESKPFSDEYKKLITAASELAKILDDDDDPLKKSAEAARKAFFVYSEAIKNYAEKQEQREKLREDKEEELEEQQKIIILALRTAATQKRYDLEIYQKHKETKINNMADAKLKDGEDIQNSIEKIKTKSTAECTCTSIDNLAGYSHAAMTWFEEIGKLNANNIADFRKKYAEPTEADKKRLDALKYILGERMYKVLLGETIKVDKKEIKIDNFDAEEYADFIGKKIIAAGVAQEIINLEEDDTKLKESITELIQAGKISEVVKMIQDTQGYGDNVRYCDFSSGKLEDLQKFLKGSDEEEAITKTVVRSMNRNYGHRLQSICMSADDLKNYKVGLRQEAEQELEIAEEQNEKLKEKAKKVTKKNKKQKTQEQEILHLG